MARKQQLTKSSLIQAIAFESGRPVGDCQEVLDTFMEVVQRVMANGGTVKITGFGRFYATEMRERSNYDPSRHCYVQQPSCVQVRFKPGAQLSSPQLLRMAESSRDKA